MKRLSEIRRLLKMEIPENPLHGSGAVFLWGPRGTGKTTYLKQRYPRARYYDLLDTQLAAELMIKPGLLKEEVLATRSPLVIIDEIQKIPALLDEIHWLLENTPTKIILCGSSARKLKRRAKNLLGGRAVNFSLFPLTTAELSSFDLDRALNKGLLPRHFLDPKPDRLLKAYINNYIKEEIIEEAIVRNIPSFSRFLNIVALTHGQLLNYANVARETGVSPSTVRDYYQILTDTLIGFELEPWKKSKSRRLIETAKYYLFDVGVAHYLNPEPHQIVEGNDIYGFAFEHLMIMEMRAFLSYKELDWPLSFWRTASGFEVDLIVGDLDLVLEFKATQRIQSSHLKGLRAFKEENTPRRCILVSRDSLHRKTEDHIELLPWEEFCKLLWRGEMMHT